MITWTLILSIATSSSFGAPVIALQGYASKNDCTDAFQSALNAADEKKWLSIHGICILGPITAPPEQKL